MQSNIYTVEEHKLDFAHTVYTHTGELWELYGLPFRHWPFFCFDNGLEIS